jgi:serine-type D-Ala-D-Ala carboxypeptidase/endopeptidase (penicillin-binding protein 4)
MAKSTARGGQLDLLGDERRAWVRIPGGWRTPAIAVLSIVTVLAVVLGLVSHFSNSVSGRAAAQTSAGAGLTSPGTAVAVLPAADDGAPAPSAAGLSKVLGPLLRQAALGPHVGAAVVDLSTGQLLYGLGASSGFTPASTTKLLTAAAALTVLGPNYRIRTKVVAGAPGQVILVGAGDPTLASTPPAGFVPAPASLPALARATALALRARGLTNVSLGYDSTLFAPPAIAATWPAGYVSSGQVAPITALTVDEGRTGEIVEGPSARVTDPALSAAQQFAKQLRRYGVSVAGTPVPAKAAPAPAGITPSGQAEPSATSSTASATGSASSQAAGLLVPGTPLASVQSPALSDLVAWMLASSDNDLAEAVAHLTALASGEPATFVGGSVAVERALADLGISDRDLRLYDGSGLTRTTSVPPQTVADVLSLAAQPSHAALRPLLTGLAVAGFTGSLQTRFTGPGTLVGTGMVRAKTGTLTNISAMAGTVEDASGRLLAFDFVADEVPATGTLAARQALDLAASALAGCGCG